MFRRPYAECPRRARCERIHDGADSSSAGNSSDFETGSDDDLMDAVFEEDTEASDCRYLDDWMDSVSEVDATAPSRRLTDQRIRRASFHH